MNSTCASLVFNATSHIAYEQSIFLPRVKMCGFTRVEDVQNAVKYGVHAIGLVFYAPSPRYVSIEQAQKLVKHIPAHIQIVALFVNESLENMQLICQNMRIDLLQFHGDMHIETPEYCALCSQALNKPYIKAIGINVTNIDANKIYVKKDAEIENYIYEMHQIYTQHKASGILLDYKTSSYGGSGQAFNWHIIPKELLQERMHPVIISGGVHLQNIAQLILLKPYAIDLSSGIESTTFDGQLLKGQKCAKKMQEILHITSTSTYKI
jgi:phosphoribosylanthranilate isomerase